MSPKREALPSVRPRVALRQPPQQFPQQKNGTYEDNGENEFFGVIAANADQPHPEELNHVIRADDLKGAAHCENYAHLVRQKFLLLVSATKVQARERLARTIRS